MHCILSCSVSNTPTSHSSASVKGFYFGVEPVLKGWPWCKHVTQVQDKANICDLSSDVCMCEMWICEAKCLWRISVWNMYRWVKFADSHLAQGGFLKYRTLCKSPEPSLVSLLFGSKGVKPVISSVLEQRFYRLSEGLFSLDTGCIFSVSIQSWSFLVESLLFVKTLNTNVWIIQS